MPRTRDKRQDILAATLKLIVERGLESTPMSLIAKEAGVGMGTIYNYFSSKEELVNVLYRELKLQASQSMLHDYDRAAPIRERFFHIWRSLLKLYLAKPDLYRFLEQCSHSPVINQESKELGMRLWEEPIRLMEEGQAQRIVKDLPIKILMLIAGAPLGNLVQGHLSRQIALDGRLIESAITACWDAIKL